jgi:hypothetical protein
MLDMDAADWERLLTTIWTIATPIGLSLAAVILGGRLVIERRWKNRMSRASALLIISYAVLMVRLVHGRWFNKGVSDPGPDPFFAAFYTFAILYFTYALVLGWVVPFTINIVRRKRGDEELEVGVEDA